MPFGKEVGLGPGHIVLDGDPAPHSSPSLLSAHVYCGQTVAHLSNCWALVSLVYRLFAQLTVRPMGVSPHGYFSLH